jgi:hypothetical protein
MVRVEELSKPAYYLGWPLPVRALALGVFCLATFALEAVPFRLGWLAFAACHSAATLLVIAFLGYCSGRSRVSSFSGKASIAIAWRRSPALAAFACLGGGVIMANVPGHSQAVGEPYNETA